MLCLANGDVELECGQSDIAKVNGGENVDDPKVFMPIHVAGMHRLNKTCLDGCPTHQIATFCIPRCRTGQEQVGGV